MVRAQRVRRWWLERMLEVFRGVDLVIAPATPFTAPRSGRRFSLGDRTLPPPEPRAAAQPFSAIGLPVAAVPVFAPGEMPIGVQLVAPPWREDLRLRAAAWLEAEAVALAHPPAARVPETVLPESVLHRR